MIASRRRFLFSAGASLLAAPSIVRVAANLMPVKPLRFSLALGDRFTIEGQPYEYTVQAIAEFSERYLKPQMAKLASHIEESIQAELAEKWWAA